MHSAVLTSVYAVRRSLLEHLGFEDMLPSAEAQSEPQAAAESSNADVTAAAARLGEP